MALNNFIGTAAVPLQIKRNLTGKRLLKQILLGIAAKHFHRNILGTKQLETECGAAHFKRHHLNQSAPTTIQSIGKPQNTAQSGAESTLTAIMGRMATDVRREVSWDEMMKSA